MEARLKGLQGHIEGRCADAKETTAYSVAFLASEPTSRNAHLKTTCGRRRTILTTN
jgi:hypothetical protein